MSDVVKRLRINWKGEKFLFLLESNLLTIADLLNSVSTFLINQRKLSEDNRIVQGDLDGYTLSSLFSTNILSNDDYINVTDQLTQIENLFEKHTFTSWYTLSEYDTHRRWISVGTFKEFNQLCVSIGKGNGRIKCEVLDLLDLLNYEDGLTLILGDEDGSCSSEIHLFSEGKVVKHVQLSLKVGNDQRPQIITVGVEGLNSDQLEKGEVSIKQLPTNYPEEIPENLPESSYEGDRIKEIERKTVDYNTPENLSEGDSNISFKQIYDPYFNIDSNYGNQFISVEFLFTNNTDEVTSVTSFKGEYKDHSGEWVSCELFTGERSQNHYSKQKDQIILFNERNASKLSLSMLIPLDKEKEKQAISYNRTHLHRMFGESIEVRYTIFDQYNKSASFQTVLFSTPYQLPTLESIAKDNAGKEIVKFISVDNNELTERLYAYYSANDKGVLNLSMPHSCYSIDLSYDTVRNIVDRSFEENKSELEMENWKWENEIYKSEHYAIVNLEKRYLIGIKSVLTSPTGKAVEYFKIDPKYYEKKI